MGGGEAMGDGAFCRKTVLVVDPNLHPQKDTDKSCALFPERKGGSLRSSGLVLGAQGV